MSRYVLIDQTSNVALYPGKGTFDSVNSSYQSSQLRCFQKNQTVASDHTPHTAYYGTHWSCSWLSLKQLRQFGNWRWHVSYYYLLMTLTIFIVYTIYCILIIYIYCTQIMICVRDLCNINIEPLQHTIPIGNKLLTSIGTSLVFLLHPKTKI